MSDADQYETNQQAAGGHSAGSGEEPPISKFEVVPNKQSNQAELYAFRETIAPQPAEPVRKQKQSFSFPVAKLFMLFAVVAGIVFLIIAVPTLIHPKPPDPYIDLGSQRFDPAGLSGRLIARWQASGSYQLFLDPIDQTQVASFAAVAQDPPRQLSVTIRFRNAAGLVACQKQILFPPPVPHTKGAKPAPATGPQQSPTGDTIDNTTGQDGQISEIDLTGPLPCSAKAYATFAAWDFSTDFPTLAEQQEWQRHEGALNAKSHAGNGEPSPQTEHLPIPIEGDDVIVGDNPSRGTVDTSGGLVFYLGAAGLRNRSAEWQVFPASIHFRCDKNGSCTLTRTNSRASIQARLLR
jgi:hypothetical protein